VRKAFVKNLAAAFSLLGLPLLTFANADIAKRFSDGSAISGTRVLIVGFEGLAGFNKSKADQLEYYQCRLTFGQKASKPMGIGGGHVTSALMVDAVEKYKNKLKIAMYAHDACKSGNCAGPEALATQWMNDANTTESTKGRKVIIVGHSFGGDAAAVLGKRLSAKGVAVDSVITIDGRLRAALGNASVGPAAGGRWINFYQKFDFFLQGFRIKGAENHFLPALPGIGHIALPYNKKILTALMEQIGDPPGEATLQLTAHNEKNCENNTLASMGAYKGTSGAIEAIPIAAVVGGGGYLAYQALTKKKSGDGGDSDDILVADSLKGKQGSKTSDENAAKGSSQKSKKIADSKDVTLETEPRTIEGLENLEKEESIEMAGASRLQSNGINKKSLEKVKSTNQTRFTSESLGDTSGRGLTNSVGGGTAALEGMKSALVSAQDSNQYFSGGGGGYSNREPAESSDEAKVVDGEESQESEFSPLSGEMEIHSAEEVLAAKVESEAFSRSSLFERVNRKLRQRMPQMKE
jgi:hypothetical protein